MKMKRIIISLGLALFFGLLISCEDNLDVLDPQSVNREQVISEQGLIQLTTGNYSEFGEQTFLGGSLQLSMDLLGSTDQVSWNGTFAQPREFFTKNLLVDNIYIRDFWLNAYEVIFQANLVLNNSDVFTSEADRTLYTGHASFLRGTSYFELVRLFGLPFEDGGANTQLGVPIVLEATDNFINNPELSVPRNTVNEVYNRAISDLTNAYNNLDGNDNTGIGLADRYAAQAILARLYLQQQDYPNALAAANDVIENSGHVLASEYSAAFNLMGLDEGTENVYSIKITTQDPAANDNDLNQFYASQPNGGRGDDVTIEAGYDALFDDPNDERLTFRDSNAANQTGKFSNEFGNIPIIRIAEMYLIRAECNLRLNSSTGDTPLNDINRLRNRANATELTDISIDGLLTERQLELGFEGFLIHDIKRTRRMVGSLDYNAPTLVLPIPQREIDANDELDQNPGYGN